MPLRLMISMSLLLAACTPEVRIDLGPGQKITQSTVIAGSTRDRVALLEVRGLINDANKETLLGPGPNPVDRFTAQLTMAAQDPAVKAIIVRINSPGGTVGASDTMYRELRRFADTTKKPVVASMSEVAASGGYYLALGADRVLAQSTTITGSIGVIFPTMNFSEGLNRIGIRAKNITSGPNKDIAYPFEPIRESQYDVLRAMVGEFYGNFKGLVAARRPSINPESLIEATDGRVVTGKRALELGLVDEIGGLREAFEAAKKLAGSPGAGLVKYVEEGKLVQSPYAASPVQPTDGSFIQLKLGDTALQPGFYYLWVP